MYRAFNLLRLIKYFKKLVVITGMTHQDGEDLDNFFGKRYVVHETYSCISFMDFLVH